MTIRDLVSLDDCRQVVALEREVWGYTDAEDVVPAPLLIVSAKRGGILLGAFDERGAMAGFVYSMPAAKNGRPTQWSHMLGVARGARDHGLGRLLKLAQRERALAMGTSLIEWTFDPLQALNAHFNFVRLGVLVFEYEENVYGESSSALHRGTPTDRFVAEWRLDSERVVRRLASESGTARIDAPVVNPSRSAARWPRPGRPDLTLDAPDVLVEIPPRFDEMQGAEPALALEWRLAFRTIAQTYLGRGYFVTDFIPAPGRAGGVYRFSLISP
ncbi:MAG TPA: hypothetical protein VFX12_07930 [Vicinamibacterales bacterium]|nr:hypothetical protein [Vicinamibacterales bacterium]